MVALLAAHVFHDINNYLTAILGHTQLLRQDAVAGAEMAESLDAVHLAASRCRDLTMCALDLARPEQPAADEADVNQVVKEAACLLTAHCRDRWSVTTSLAHDAWPVRADPGGILRVVMNLCLNAIRAMPQGGKVTLTTENTTVGPGTRSVLSPVAPGRYVRLAIADQGVGLRVEDLGALLRPFVKGELGGWGLGLSSVRCVLEHYAAHISARLAGERGTIFELLWPAVASESRPRAGIAADPPVG